MDSPSSRVLEIESLSGVVQAQGADLVLGDHSVGPSGKDVGSGELVEADPGAGIERVYPTADILEGPVLQTESDRAGVVQLDPLAVREQSLVGAVSVRHHLVDADARAGRGAAGGASGRGGFAQSTNQDRRQRHQHQDGQ